MRKFGAFFAIEVFNCIAKLSWNFLIAVLLMDKFQKCLLDWIPQDCMQSFEATRIEQWDPVIAFLWRDRKVGSVRPKLIRAIVCCWSWRGINTVSEPVTC